jgi:hypothetical protein
VRCRSCRQEFGSSTAPAVDLRSTCWDKARMTRAAAAIPELGKRAGIARPLKAMTSARQRPVAVPRAYLLELDDGVDLLTPRR